MLRVASTSIRTALRSTLRAGGGATASPVSSRLLPELSRHVVSAAIPQRSMVTIYHSPAKGPMNGSKPKPGDRNAARSSDEIEKHLAELQREVSYAHAEGDFERALELAGESQEQLAEYFGEDHPVVASAWNNIAILRKRLGRFDSAIDAYLTAINKYRSVAGEKHPQFVTTLANLGLCFQAAAQANKGLDRVPLLERAVEAFEEVVKLRSEHEVSYSDAGGSHETIGAQALAQLKLAEYYLTEALSAPLQRTKKATTTTTTGTKDKATKARNLPPKEECAQLALEAAEAYLIAVRTRATKKAAQQGVGGVWNAGRAELGTCHNNVGFLLKVVGRLAEAKPMYIEAIALREAALGPLHSDTMASKHNLAELLQASGDAEGAAEMRRAILDEMGVEDMGEEEEGDAGRDIDVSKMDKF